MVVICATSRVDLSRRRAQGYSLTQSSVPGRLVDPHTGPSAWTMMPCSSAPRPCTHTQKPRRPLSRCVGPSTGWLRGSPSGSSAAPPGSPARDRVPMRGPVHVCRLPHPGSARVAGLRGSGPLRARRGNLPIASNSRRLSNLSSHHRGEPDGVQTAPRSSVSALSAVLAKFCCAGAHPCLLSKPEPARTLPALARVQGRSARLYLPVRKLHGGDLPRGNYGASRRPTLSKGAGGPAAVDLLLLRRPRGTQHVFGI